MVRIPAGRFVMGCPASASDCADDERPAHGVYLSAYEIDVHERLAELHGEVGNPDGAVRERGAIVALDPVDRAAALYRLAVAQHEAGDARGARRSVMGALEIAPNFEEALEFFMLIRGSSR